MAEKTSNQIERKVHVVDVAKRPLGRVATEIAILLMGKDRENYRPHEDKGGFVVATNIEKIVLTGNKSEAKEYYYHSGYPGGLKKVSYKKLLERGPGTALKKAVYGMLPKNKLRTGRIKRFSIE